MRRVVLFLCVFAFLAGSLFAQTAATAEQRAASYEARKGDFDYLLGDWRFTAKSKQWGEFTGRWSAVRLRGGQILDEWRVLDDEGHTVYVTTTLRAYNAALDRWELVGMDEGGGLQDVGTGKVVGGEVLIEQVFGAVTERPTMRRIRYYNVRPDRFSWTSDLSADGGKTWDKEELTMEAQRIGPPRSFGALTPDAK
jgi:hypothetical protein